MLNVNTWAAAFCLRAYRPPLNIGTKTASCPQKDNLLEGKRQPFTMQKTAFYNSKGSLSQPYNDHFPSQNKPPVCRFVLDYV